VTRLRDDADLHPVVFFDNQRVDPTLDYTYDPTYRSCAQQDASIWAGRRWRAASVGADDQ